MGNSPSAVPHDDAISRMQSTGGYRDESFRPSRRLTAFAMKLKGFRIGHSKATEEHKAGKERKSFPAGSLEPSGASDTHAGNGSGKTIPLESLESHNPDLTAPPPDLKAPWAHPVPTSGTGSESAAPAPGNHLEASDGGKSAPTPALTGGREPGSQQERTVATSDGGLDEATPSGRSMCQSSSTERSPELTVRSSEQDSHRSLIQVPNTNYQSPPHIQLDQFLHREPSAPFDCTDSETGTPVSRGGVWQLDSQVSSGTVVVRTTHKNKPSLTFTASIEDYAKKANPSTWEPAKFRKSQLVRIQPGIYPVPYKKLSESHSQYTKLNAYVKGTIHQIHKSTDSRDPREFVTDEGLVMYRVFVLRRVNINVEFIFVLEDQMTAFNECARCNAYASQKCTGCNKEWYCSEHCATIDWRTHRQDCKHKGKAPPPFNAEGSAGVESSAGEGNAQPAAAAKVPNLVPRREFRTDGTVKIINGYKPDPEMYRGTTTVLPPCLRPLTLDEELAPLPPSRISRMWRSASHSLRRKIHKAYAARVMADADKLSISEEVGEEPGPVGQIAGPEEGAQNGDRHLEVKADQEGASGPVVAMTADATFQGLVSAQQDSLIGEALADDPLPHTDNGCEESLPVHPKDPPGHLTPNCHNSPSSDKSAESLVEGMAPPFASSEGLQAIMHQDSQASMPDLPRIRVRSQAPLTKVIGKFNTRRSLRGRGSPKRAGRGRERHSTASPNASAKRAKSGVAHPVAKGSKRPPSKLGTVASAGPRTKDANGPTAKEFLESLPEVFKRLTSSSNLSLDSSGTTDRSQKV